MFINCRHCNALVATDPATDAPPARCPRCAGILREPSETGSGDGEAVPARDQVDAPDVAATTTATTDTDTDTDTDKDAVIDARPGADARPVTAGTGDDPASRWQRAANLFALLSRRQPAGDTDATADDTSAHADTPPLAHDDGALEQIDRTPAQADRNDDPAGAWQRAADLVAGLSSDRRQMREEDTAADSLDAVQTDPPAVTAATGIDTEAPVIDDATEACVAAAPSDADAHTDTGSDANPGVETPVDALPSAPAPAADHATPVATPPARPAPSFVAPQRRHAAPSAARPRWRAPAAIGALSLLLIVQILLADRARLAMDAGWRPLLSSLCGAFGCSLPPWREPQALTLLVRDVRPHPDRPGVLRATATFRNDARWPQAWPTLVLTLSDVQGRVAGTRAFTAGEYLGSAPTDNTLASGQSAMIRLDVAEPAADVVAFSFDFH